MSATSVIYRRELGAYLRSPWSWAIISAALLLAGIAFLAMDLKGEQLSAIVLERFFWSTSWCTSVAAGLLSIRLVAEDRQTGALVLLNTSPVREVSIILGKYLAALTFVALMVALTFYMPLLIKIHGKVTGSQILIGCFGLLLLAAAVLAIGVFASALAPNQLIAAVITGAVALGMCMLWPLSQVLSSPLREVLGACDLWWVHYQQGTQRGVINLKDVVYYFAVIYFFLLLAVKTMEAKRWQ
jgi:ABC-2 type transport system permease protein|nr:ABC transporter permease [Kofleriaceae bacterium]